MPGLVNFTALHDSHAWFDAEIGNYERYVDGVKDLRPMRERGRVERSVRFEGVHEVGLGIGLHLIKLTYLRSELFANKV